MAEEPLHLEAGISRESPLWNHEAPTLSEMVQFITVVDVDKGPSSSLSRPRVKTKRSAHQMPRSATLVIKKPVAVAILEAPCP